MRNIIKKNECNAANYIGNRLATSLELMGPDKKKLRDKYHIGEPRDCAAGSSVEMKRRGYVGIYEKESRIRMSLPKFNFLLAKAATESW